MKSISNISVSLLLCVLLCCGLFCSCSSGGKPAETEAKYVDVKGSVSLGSLDADGFELSARQSDFSGGVVRLSVSKHSAPELSSRLGIIVGRSFELSYSPTAEPYSGGVSFKIALTDSDNRLISYDDSLLIGRYADGVWSYFRPDEVTESFASFYARNDGVYSMIYASDNLICEVYARECGTKVSLLNSEDGFIDCLLSLCRDVCETYYGAYNGELDDPIKTKLSYYLPCRGEFYVSDVLQTLSAAFAEALSYNSKTLAYQSSLSSEDEGASSALSCAAKGDNGGAAVYICDMFTRCIDYDALSARCDEANKLLTPTSYIAAVDEATCTCAVDFIEVLKDKALLQRGKYGFDDISTYERLNDMFSTRNEVAADLNIDFGSGSGTTSAGKLFGMLVYVKLYYNEDTYNACIASVRDGGYVEETDSTASEPSDTTASTEPITDGKDTSAVKDTEPSDTDENLVAPPITLEIKTLSRVSHSDDGIVYKLDMSKYAFVDSALAAAGKMNFSKSILGSFSISVPDYSGKSDIFDVRVTDFIISGTYNELNGTGSCTVSFTAHITCEEDGETGGYLITYSGKGKIATGLYSDGGYYLSFSSSGAENTVGEGIFKGDNSKFTESVDFALQIN